MIVGGVQWPIKPVVKITIIASSADNPAVETVVIFTIGSNDQYAYLPSNRGETSWFRRFVSVWCSGKKLL